MTTSTSTTTPAPEAQHPEKSPGAPLTLDKKRRLTIFLILMTAAFMSMMDVQIVATALPTIVGEFGDISGFSWIASAYLLTSSAVMPLYGKLGDLFGRKYVIITVVGLFVIGSLACATAVSINTLIAARVLQAIGGGGIMVTIFAINADLFEPRERAKYQSYSSLVLMTAGAAGPTLGGLMTDLFGWRSIFLINLPIGIVVIAGLALLLPYKRPERKPKVDYVGAVLLAGVICSLVLWADSATLFGSLLAPQSLLIVLIGVTCALAWVYVEKRVEEPVIPLRLFKDQTISLLLIVTLASGCMGIGMANYYALFLQSGLGMTPSIAGLFFIPLTTGIAVGSVSAGRIMSRTGGYKYFAVASTATTACVLIAVSLIVDQTTSLAIVAVLLFLHGIGTGIGQQVPILGVQNAAPRQDIGSATGMTTLSRIGGASIGISIYGAIVSYMISHAPQTVPGVGEIETLTPSEIVKLPVDVQHAINDIYLMACNPVLLTAAGIGLTGCVAALFLENRRLGSK
ncbi:MDR family MFS transporter [Roseibium sp.]|uniref:MDR family MFS transporter n=1 Tax=Roseibium sp. TaxID=1936156 RepID=UPI003A98301F